MQSDSEDFFCGVCSKRINDPYKLPCGHTFCLRPCLLAHAKSVKARCIRCHLEFCASELRPDYSVGAKLHSKLFEKSQIDENGGNMESGTLQNERDLTRCSNCRKPMEAKQLVYCQHCYRNVCSLCLVKHFDSFSLSVRIKLTALTREKMRLSSDLQNLRDQSRTKPPNFSTKDSIIAELDEAIAQLTRAVSVALDNATSKIELLDNEGLANLNQISEKLLASGCDLGEIRDIYPKLEGNQMRLQDLAKVYQRIKGIRDDAALLPTLIDDHPALPVTLLEVSDRVYKIIEEVSDFNLLILDDSVSLRTIPSCKSAGQILSRCHQVNITETGESTVKLYVGGLRTTHTEELLRRHFESAYGPLVDCYVAKDFRTKVSRCYGFVTFREAVHASNALADIPHFIEGTPVQIRPYRADLFRRTPSTYPKDEQTVLLTGISGSSTEDSIKAAMSMIGPVRSIKLDSKRGYAALTFEESKTASLAEAIRLFSIDGDVCEIMPFSKRIQNFKNEEESRADIRSQNIFDSRLFVGNISLSVTQTMLKKYFSKYGSVMRIDVVKEHGSGTPRGIAFVSMSTEEEAKAVLAKCPHSINGQKIIVRPAYARDSGLKAALMNSPLTADTQMVIHDIPINVSRQDLLKCFSKFGGITALRIDNARHKGFLTFSSAESLKSALESSPHQVDGRNLQVSLAKDTGASSASEPNQTLEIHVTDIPPSASALDLKAFFAKFGGVLKANVYTKGDSRFGFVKMSSFEAVKNAINCKSPTINGNYITIRAAFSKQQAASHRSAVRLMKKEKPVKTPAYDKTIDSNPAKLQETSKPAPIQGQLISETPRPSTSTTSSKQKSQPSELKKLSLSRPVFGDSDDSEPALSSYTPFGSDSDYDEYAGGKYDTELGDIFW